MASIKKKINRENTTKVAAIASPRANISARNDADYFISHVPEVVYIGSLNPQHLEMAKLMLQNGKHVLCEKPLTLNKKQTTELIAFAQNKELFLMEAIWSRCFPAYRFVNTSIAVGTIGDVKQVIVSFGFDLSDVERLK